MICTCRLEGVQETEERRLRIFRRLKLNSENLIQAIMLSLAFDFQAEVEIYADMWFGVSLHSPLLTQNLYIECDHPADGLAYLWEILAEKFPEKVSSNSEYCSFSAEVCEKIAQELFDNYACHKTDYQNHKKLEHVDAGHSPNCQTCQVSFGLGLITKHTLQDFWGFNGLDAAIEKTYQEG